MGRDGGHRDDAAALLVPFEVGPDPTIIGGWVCLETCLSEPY